MSTYSLEIYSVDFNIFLRNSRHTGFRLVETKDDGSISIKIMEISQDDGVTTGKAYTTVGHVYNIDGKDFIWDKKGGGSLYSEDEIKDTFNAQYQQLDTGDSALEIFNQISFYGKMIQGLHENGEAIDYDPEGPNCNTFTATMLSKFSLDSDVYSQFNQYEDRYYWGETEANNGFLGVNPNGFIEDNQQADANKYRAIDNLYNELSKAGRTDIIENIGTSSDYSINYDSETISIGITCFKEDGSKIIIGSDGGETTLTGSSLSDYIDGRAGNDIISGGAGDDTLIGGSGDDIYKYYLGDGVDDIVDEEGVCDEIKLYNLDITKLSGSYNKISYDGETIITASGIDKVSLNGENINFNNYEQDGNTDAVFTDGSVKIDMEDYGAQALTYMNMPLARQGYLDQYLMPIYEQEHSQWQTSHAIWQGAYQAWVEGGCVGDAPTAPSAPTTADFIGRSKRHKISRHKWT